MDSRSRAAASSARAGRDAERGRGDMDADAQVPAGQRGHRERIVDLGGGDVVDAERLDLRQRQVLRHGGAPQVRERRAARKMLEQEAVEVVIVRRRQRAAALEELRGRRLQLLARLLQRLPFDALLVRPVEQLRRRAARTPAAACPLQAAPRTRALLRLASLALDRRERRLERLRRRRLVAALALLVEIHRRAVELAAAAPPTRAAPARGRSIRGPASRTRTRPGRSTATENPRRSPRRACCASSMKCAEAGAVEAQQHGGGLDLGALAVRRLDLQRGIVVGEHGADLEAALLFVENVLAHGSISGAMNRRREGG